MIWCEYLYMIICKCRFHIHHVCSRMSDSRWHNIISRNLSFFEHPEDISHFYGGKIGTTLETKVARDITTDAWWVCRLDHAKAVLINTLSSRSNSLKITAPKVRICCIGIERNTYIMVLGHDSIHPLYDFSRAHVLKIVFLSHGWYYEFCLLSPFYEVWWSLEKLGV